MKSLKVNPIVLILYMASGMATMVIGPLGHAISPGIFHVGQAFGSIIPSMFFMESYRDEWISRGQTPEAMDEMIKYTSGTMGVLSTVIVFTLAVVGVIVGYAILNKHFEKKQIQA